MTLAESWREGIRWIPELYGESNKTGNFTWMIGCARTVEKNKLMYGKPEFTGEGGIVADPSIAY